MKLDVPSRPFYSGSPFFNGYQIPLRVIHVENSRPYPEHRHAFDELVLILSGSGTHKLNGTAYKIEKGDVFLIRNGSIHEYLNPENLNLVNIIYDSAILHEKRMQLYFNEAVNSGIKLSIFTEKEALGIINKIDQELLNRRTAYPFVVQACFIQLLCLLCRNSPNNNDTSDFNTNEKIKNTISFLEKENGPAISIRDMAEEAGTSLRNFHRIFKKITGYSPVKYINLIRINKSCDLLLSTDKTITQIASLVNYEDSNYFTRQFKRIIGHSPTDFRNSKSLEELPKLLSIPIHSSRPSI